MQADYFTRALVLVIDDPGWYRDMDDLLRCAHMAYEDTRSRGYSLRREPLMTLLGRRERSGLCPQGVLVDATTTPQPMGPAGLQAALRTLAAAYGPDAVAAAASTLVETP